MKTCIFAYKPSVRFVILFSWAENYESATDGKHATVYEIVITSLCFYKNKILAIQNAKKNVLKKNPSNWK